MIVLRDKNFSFLETLKGNPKLRKSLLEYQKLSISKEIKNDFYSIKNDDFLKYATWLNENVPTAIFGGVTMRSSRGVSLIIYSYKDIFDQLNGKFPVAVQRIQEPRIVLLQTNYGDNDFLICYYQKRNSYVITKESARYNILSRAINSMSGDKGPQEIKSFSNFGSAFNYIQRNIVEI